MTKRTGVILGALVALALVAVACASSKNINPAATTTSQNTTAASTFNDADVSFAQDMIPHHQQAVVMSDLALRQSQNQAVRSLATQIRDAQQPEIQTMQGWLKAWGKTPQSSTTSSMPGMDHGSSTSAGGTTMTMSSGMMSDADINSMSTLTGAAFDRMFLDGMIKHHQGAITMAQTERSNGSFPGAKQMAENIISSQQGEIDRMTQLLKTL